MTSLRRWALKIFLCLFIVASGFSGYYWFKAVRWHHVEVSRFSGDSFVQDDPVLGFVQRPNISTRYIFPPYFSIHTDNRGLRVGRPGMVTPSKIDLLALGCSYTWGHGVEEPQTYVRILAEKKGLVTVNAAMASYGTTSAYLSLLRFADLCPSVILYGFIEDHILRSMKPCARTLSPYCLPTAFVGFDASGAPFLQAPAHRSEKYYRYMKDIVMSHALGWRDFYWALQRDMLTLTKKNKESINARYSAAEDPVRRTRVMRYLVDLMQKTSSRMGARLIIVYMPEGDPPRPIPHELLEAMRPYMRNGGLFFLDTTPSLAAYAEKHGWKALRAAGHPNALAHQIIAQDLELLLEEMLDQK